MDFKFNMKNNIGLISSLVLVILLSQSIFFNLLTETGLGRFVMLLFIFLISYITTIIIIQSSYVNKFLLLLTVLVLAVAFNYNISTVEGLTGLPNTSGWGAVSALSKASSDATKALADASTAATKAKADADAAATKAIADKAAADAKAVSDKAAADMVAAANAKADADAKAVAYAKAEADKAIAYKQAVKESVLKTYPDFNPYMFDEFYAKNPNFNLGAFIQAHPLFRKHLKNSTNKYSMFNKAFNKPPQIESFVGFVQNMFG